MLTSGLVPLRASPLRAGPVIMSSDYSHVPSAALTSDSRRARTGPTAGGLVYHVDTTGSAAGG